MIIVFKKIPTHFADWMRNDSWQLRKVQNTVITLSSINDASFQFNTFPNIKTDNLLLVVGRRFFQLLFADNDAKLLRMDWHLTLRIQ